MHFADLQIGSSTNCKKKAICSEIIFSNVILISFNYFSACISYNKMVNYSIILDTILNRGSNISAHLVLNLFNKLRKRDKIQGIPKFFIAF